jgi:hypothetical protein
MNKLPTTLRALKPADIGEASPAARRSVDPDRVHSTLK